MKWLKEKENVDWAPIISVFGNRPVLLNEMGHDYLTNQIDSLSSQITGLIDGKMKPSEISDLWKNEDIELNLRLLYSWIFQYMETKLLQKNHVQNLPNGLSLMLDKNINAVEGLLLFCTMLLLRKTVWGRRPGALSMAYLAFYALARISMEFFREPDDGQFLIAWMTKGQFYSALMILGALVIGWRMRLFHAPAEDM